MTYQTANHRPPPRPAKADTSSTDQALTALLRERTADVPLLLEVASDSMRPILRRGDRVIVAKVDPAALAPRDIIVYHRDPSTLFMHRLSHSIRHQGARYFICRGDASPHFDAPVPEERLVGKVVSIKRLPWLKRQLAAGRAYGNAKMIHWRTAGKTLVATVRSRFIREWCSIHGLVSKATTTRAKVPDLVAKVHHWFTQLASSSRSTGRYCLQAAVLRTQHLPIFRTCYHSCYQWTKRRFLLLCRNHPAITSVFLRHSFAEKRMKFGASDLDFSVVLPEDPTGEFLADFSQQYWRLRRKIPLIGEVEIGTREEWRQWRRAPLFRSRFAPSWQLLAGHDPFDVIPSSPTYSLPSLVSEMIIRWLFFHWHFLASDTHASPSYRGHLCSRDLEGLAVGAALIASSQNHNGNLPSFPETTWHELLFRCLQELPPAITGIRNQLSARPGHLGHQQAAFAEGTKLIVQISSWYEKWLIREGAQLIRYPQANPLLSRGKSLFRETQSLSNPYCPPVSERIPSRPFSAGLPPTWVLLSPCYPEHHYRFMVIPEDEFSASHILRASLRYGSSNIIFVTPTIIKILPSLFFGGALPGYAELGHLSPAESEREWRYYVLPEEKRRSEARTFMAQAVVWYRFWLISGASSWARTLAQSLLCYNGAPKTAPSSFQWPDTIGEQSRCLESLIGETTKQAAIMPPGSAKES